MTTTTTPSAPPATAHPRTVRAPRGTEISCRGWQQEAALRMLLNNLDPEVAERPEELVVYGGSGKAARNWECFEAIVATLKRLGEDETLLVQSGKPVAVFKTHADAPRVLLASHPTRGIDVGAQAAVWHELREARAAGLATLLVSADLDELIGLSDRLLVMYRGRVVAELDPAEVAPADLGAYMTGAATRDDAA